MTKNHLTVRSVLKVSFYIVLCCLFLVPYQDKANTHKKLLDDAEEPVSYTHLTLPTIYSV